jgi:hypothetical protein
MLSDAIKRAFEKKLVRGWGKWPKMFWAIDLHDVIIPGTYTVNNDNRAFYPCAKEVLQELSHRKDMCLILFTSSHESSIDDIIKWLGGEHITFDHVNENPWCHSNELCCFKKKFYFDIMLEDKAGFNGMEDWLNIKKTLESIGEWKNSYNTCMD